MIGIYFTYLFAIFEILHVQKVALLKRCKSYYLFFHILYNLIKALFCPVKYLIKIFNKYLITAIKIAIILDEILIELLSLFAIREEMFNLYYIYIYTRVTIFNIKTFIQGPKYITY